MAIVKPFKGVTYNLEKVLLKQVISPATLVTDEKLNEKYALKSNYNISNLMITPENKDFDNNFLMYKQWKKEEVLLKSTEHVFYLYEQEFEFNGDILTRTGFVGLKKIDLKEFDCIMDEYQNFDFDPALEFIKATKSNINQVLGLYKDESRKLDSLFLQIKKTMPVLSAVDDNLIKNTIWLIDDEQSIKQIEDYMKDKNILIADGYDAYHTAVKYCKYMRKLNNDSSEDVEPYDFIMVTFFNIFDEGIKLFNSARVIEINENFDFNEFYEKLENYFEIIEVNENSDLEMYNIIMSFQNKKYGLVLEDEVLEKLHPTQRKIDSYVFNKTIIEDILKEIKDGYVFKLLNTDELDFNDSSQIIFNLTKEPKKTVMDMFEQNNDVAGACVYTIPKLQSGLIINEL